MPSLMLAQPATFYSFVGSSGSPVRVSVRSLIRPAPRRRAGGPPQERGRPNKLANRQRHPNREGRPKPRAALEAIEGPLLEEGYEHVIVPTQRGKLSESHRNGGRSEACELESDEAFQRFEDALLKAGYTEIMATTARGIFHFKTAE